MLGGNWLTAKVRHAHSLKKLGNQRKTIIFSIVVASSFYIFSLI